MALAQHQQCQQQQIKHQHEQEPDAQRQPGGTGLLADLAAQYIGHGEKDPAQQGG